MISLVLAAVLAADAGLPDGGEYVVLDVNHAALWLNLADGGVSDAPLAVRGGAWLDDDALMHSAREKARGEGAAAVSPDVDTRTVLLVGAVMLVAGAVLGFASGFAAGHKF